VTDDGLNDSATTDADASMRSDTLEGLDSHCTDSVTLPELSLSGDSGRSNSTTAGGGA
jgi:hypothetical protein